MDTKENIQQTFVRQYAQKDYAMMTIKDLCAAVPIARTTFYTYYDNLDDLKTEIEDNLIMGLLNVVNEIADGDIEKMIFAEFLDATQCYIQAHWDTFDTFLIRQPNLRFIDKWKAAIKQNFKKRYPDKISLPNYDLIAEMLASATISAYSYWMQNPSKVNTEEMKKLITQALESIVKLLEL
ncbi:TetR/AcrR family transcriptional regulator [Streptococcus gallolyticus]|uniref:TetR/AcrR family transcriptional regulator n=1 Tax=Streptococcus gallolyticus TaxID=315405 RepID=UPI0022834E54|nr:TetR/AcrR family transcriptional regulator C-terminal domain-containing protein [Streptococcus gallolyticus]MCY7190914.1 TetR/AcrR family transcriptional regulator C-terminal domain-containing protein [Streptococcus gallolyticus subsp. gallolyticus]